MDFTAPKKNVAQFELEKGMKVADLGAGSGHYTIAAGEAVGDTGRVYAIEVQKDLLPRLKNLAQVEGVHNVEILWGDIEENQGTKIGDRVVDAVIISNVLFQVEDKHGTIKEAIRILKPGGKLLFVDWSGPFGGMGPEEGAVILPDQARQLLEGEGLTFDKTIQTGPQHYGFIMKKS